MTTNITRRRMASRDTRRRRSRLLLHHGPFCALCGKLMLPTTVTLDHIHPWNRGGPDTLTNLQLAHRTCNEQRERDLRHAEETARQTRQLRLNLHLPKTPHQWDPGPAYALAEATN